MICMPVGGSSLCRPPDYFAIAHGVRFYALTDQITVHGSTTPVGALGVHSALARCFREPSFEHRSRKADHDSHHARTTPIRRGKARNTRLFGDGRRREIVNLLEYDSRSLEPTVKTELNNRAPAPTGPSTNKAKPWVGATLFENQTRVIRVLPNSPAQKAGLRVGDSIVSVEGKETKAAKEAKKQLVTRSPGDRVFMVVLRGGVERSLFISIGKRPQ